MSRQLRFDEDFIEDCRMAEIPDDILELGRCCGCGHLAELNGGYCADCAEPIKEDDDEDTTVMAKVPRFARAGKEKTHDRPEAG
ncbi:MAG: hypothetical protein ABFD52_08980 [Acidobacteriota bacterium]